MTAYAEPPNGGDSPPSSETGPSTAERPRLKWAILAPFTVIILLATGLIAYATYQYEQEALRFEASRTRQILSYLYRTGLNDHADILAASIDSIAADKDIGGALATKDAPRLLQLSQSHFNELRRERGITHWYYVAADRTALLRVHQPSRSGDTIDRYTMLEAQRTGHPAHGVEIGPLGTFTLRYVQPVYAPNNEPSVLIGYIEMGMEIEHLFSEIQDIMDVGISVFIDKSKLNRPTWEAGARMLGRTPDWDRFPNLVHSSFHDDSLFASLLDQLQENPDHSQLQLGVQSAIRGRVHYWVVPVPLYDARNQTVGFAAAYVDATATALAQERRAAAIIAITAAAAVLVFAFFHRLLSATERRLIESDSRLRALATHDGLTGLLNHRAFQDRLEQETLRALRYSKQLSLLMIDVDFFKRVNDTYGHQAGDVVLSGISRLITNQCRSIDSACRYGGEEIAVLLPEAPLSLGCHVAERIRHSIEAAPFGEQGRPAVSVTVSIGVSEFPGCADSAGVLLEEADQAMYKAKATGRNRVVAAKLIEG